MGTEIDNSDGFLGELHIADIPFVTQLVSHRAAVLANRAESHFTARLVLGQCLEVGCSKYMFANSACLVCDLFGV